MLLNNERFPLILALVAGAAMVALTAWQGYRFWQMEGQQGQYDNVQPLVSDPAAGREPPSVDLSSLDLFGAASGESEPVEMDTENLPETNLRLFTRGVLAADGDFPGSALIEDEKSKTEANLVGDELPGNATLRSVHPNRVIIERPGKPENSLLTGIRRPQRHILHGRPASRAFARRPAGCIPLTLESARFRHQR